MYSLLCRHAKFSLLPNQQAADEELSTYYRNGNTSRNTLPSPLKRFLEKHKRMRTALLLVVLLGACMVIGDGVLTPAISGIIFLKTLGPNGLVYTFFCSSPFYKESHGCICPLKLLFGCLQFCLPFLGCKSVPIN